jgi:hypothetical protein
LQCKALEKRVGVCHYSKDTAQYNMLNISIAGWKVNPNRARIAAAAAAAAVMQL